MIFLGIDTSCYTTSIAAVDENGNLLSDQRKLLNVPDGQRGLRQSEGFYQHVNALPMLYGNLLKDIGENPQCMCVSATPRACKGSYMPVFYAGVRMAEMVAQALGIELYMSDHQRGHVMAALSGCALKHNKFIAVHLSGGTTEVLNCEIIKNQPECTIISGTGDISAGQLLDRLGVKMGFSFPAGKYIDELAISQEGRRIRIPSYADTEKCSFSGTETAALRALNNGVDKTTVAEGVMYAVCEALSTLIYNAALKTGVFDVLITGGVASSKYLRSHLQSILGEKYDGIKVYFTQPRLSSDNAVGTALLARARYMYLAKGE